MVSMDPLPRLWWWGPWSRMLCKWPDHKRNYSIVSIHNFYIFSIKLNYIVDFYCNWPIKMQSVEQRISWRWPLFDCYPFLGESGAFIWGSVRHFTNTPVLSPNSASMSKLLPEAPEKLARKLTKLVTCHKKYRADESPNDFSAAGDMLFCT